MKTRLFFITCALLLQASCTVHKIDIQQGNVIEDDIITQLKTGMTKDQVIYVAGTPLIKDPFHKNRWDYLYSLKQHQQDLVRQHMISIFEGDILTKITINIPDK